MLCEYKKKILYIRIIESEVEKKMIKSVYRGSYEYKKLINTR